MLLFHIWTSGMNAMREWLCAVCILSVILIIYGLSLRVFPMSDWPDPPVMTAEVTVSTSDSIPAHTDIPKSPSAFESYSDWSSSPLSVLWLLFHSNIWERERTGEQESIKGGTMFFFLVTLFFETYESSKIWWHLNNFCTPTSTICL